jgi:hypothetical protein
VLYFVRNPFTNGSIQNEGSNEILANAYNTQFGESLNDIDYPVLKELGSKL